MSRALFVTTFFLAITLQAAEPIAPLDPILGPTSGWDYRPASITNGDSTLVAWANTFSPYQATHAIYVRLLGTPQQAATRVASGYTAELATDGKDYLVAVSSQGSRFYDLSAVYLYIVRADGSLGPSLALSQGFTFAGAAAFDGTHWLVGYSDDGHARVAVLDGGLSVVETIELGNGAITKLFEAGGSLWAVWRNQDGSQHAVIEVSGNRRYALERPPRIVTTPAGALALYLLTPEILVSTFDPATGFSAPRTILTGALLMDQMSWQSGALLLTYDEATTTWNAVTLDANGAIVETVALTKRPWPQHQLSLGPARNGFHLFDSHDNDLYADDLLVSQIDRARQWAPAIVDAGDHAVAFWTQVVDASGASATFARVVDASGHPVGEPVRLPFFMYESPAVVRDGSRLVLVWGSGSVSAASVTLNGQPFDPPQFLGAGYDPAIAVREGSTFVLWRDADYQVTGTSVRLDLSPVVPGGFCILPSFGSGQSAPAIAATANGFLVFWSDVRVRSVTLTPMGNPTSMTEPVDEPGDAFTVASGPTSALAAWAVSPKRSTLFAYGGDRPFERFEVQWGNWFPVAIVNAGGDRYVVAFRRGTTTYAADVTMESGFITGLTTPRVLANAVVSKHGVAALHGHALAVYEKDSRVFVSSDAEGPAQRRSVRK